jgi:hypothetical protein
LGEDIDIRLRKLRKHASDVIRELNGRDWKEDFKVAPAEFSNAKNGILKTPKASTIISRTLTLLCEWEAQNGRKN